MKQPRDRTRTVFRKFKDGAVIALFVDIPESTPGSCLSYMHVGQHGAADYLGVMLTTKAATSEEKRQLWDELLAIGYDIKCIKRRYKSRYKPRESL
jgi:hypothetical protein